MAGEESLDFVWAHACALAPVSWETIKDSLSKNENSVIEIQEEIERKTLTDLAVLLSEFPTPPPLLVAVLGIYDLRWLKRALAARLRLEAPRGDLCPFSKLNPLAWPDIEAVTRASPYRGVPSATGENLWPVFLDLDARYFAELRKACEDESPLRVFLVWEESAETALTALRLRFLFGWDSLKARPFLGRGSEKALQLFSFSEDRREEWETWPFAELLKSEEGVPWKADPEIFEENLRRRSLQKARTLFQSRPGTLEAIFGFFRWRLGEASLLNRRAEAVGLGLPETRARILGEVS
jgi:hypothetical protein